MARNRSGQDLIDDAYARADLQSATDRHPRASVLRYVNQGGAELWDVLIEARGGEYFQASPSNTTTTADTTAYSLPAGFYLLLGVRLSFPISEPLVAFTAHEEPMLRSADIGAAYPTHYQLRRTVAGANSIAVLPAHNADLTLTVDYVPEFTDLTDSGSSYFDGINGWEEYIVCFAARCMLTKDGETQDARAMEAEMARVKARIMKLAPKRNMHRARRVTDVRGQRNLTRRWY